MMEAMKREDRPMMEEERPVVESVTAPAAPDNVLDRRNRLCCERRARGPSDQCLGVIRYQESCRKKVQSNVRINLSRIVHLAVSKFCKTKLIGSDWDLLGQL